MCALNINPFINNLSHCIYISFHWPPQKCPGVFVIPRACIPQPRCNLLKPRLYFFREGSPPRFQGGQAQLFQNMAKMPSRAPGPGKKSYQQKRLPTVCPEVAQLFPGHVSSCQDVVTWSSKSDVICHVRFLSPMWLRLSLWHLFIIFLSIWLNLMCEMMAFPECASLLTFRDATPGWQIVALCWLPNSW